MRVGIIGDKKRASAWEQHVRPLHAVDEVIITTDLSRIKEAGACILLDNSENKLHLLSESIRFGVHTYLVSDLPTDEAQLKRIHSLSQESDVRVQFSHWPTLSPATQWMKQQLPRPEFIQIIREQSRLNFTENRPRFDHYWMEEIGWIIKWMNMSTHRVQAQKVLPVQHEYGNRIYMKFENGGSASLFYLAAGEQNRHRRIASGGTTFLDNDIELQTVKKTSTEESGKSSLTSHNFDTAKSAELSAQLFFKAVKMRNNTAFDPYDALQTATAIKQIKEMLKLN